MSKEDSNQIDNLNQSRFLIQELNLQEQPTQQQVLERAEELEIDDLILARESLTKQLQPQWRPYCNRHSQIYYINLIEKLAYIDHPIDMFFKKQYAKNNDLPIPRFKSFKIQQVCNSLDLVEQQIKNFKTKSHKTTLRIVYEQPSQEQALSSHPKSPNNGYFQFQPVNYEEDMNIEEVQELISFQRDLELRYEQQFKKKKKEILIRQKNAKENFQRSIKHILDSKLQEISNQYEEQITKKNKADLKKQIQKLEIEYQDKRNQFSESLHRFNIMFQKLREKQRNIENMYESKNASKRIFAVQNMHQKQQLEKLKALQLMKEKISKQFRQKVLEINANSQVYQKDLKSSLQKLYQEANFYATQKPVPKRKIFEQKNQVEVEKSSIKRDMQYEELKKQIRDLCLWSDQDLSTQTKSYATTANSYKNSLNLRLRMRIL